MKFNEGPWLRLKLEGSKESIEIISALLNQYSLGSIDCTNHIELFFNSADKSLLEKKINEFKSIYDYKYMWSEQLFENWHTTWKENFKPILIRDKLGIFPDWETDIPNLNYAIKIKPGMAFGTGHHETTFLMLKALLDIDLKDHSILDLGAGSGILSFLSILLGAKKIVSVDNDPLCKDNFLENMQINNFCHSRISYILSDVKDWYDFNYDIVLANINRNILSRIIPKFKNVTGRIFLSGILKKDETFISDRVLKFGMKVNNVDYKGDWVIMEICKK